MIVQNERVSTAMVGQGGALVFPRDRVVPELFEAQATRTPDAQAVSAPDRALTYRELDREANRLANYLRARGVGPDVRVGLCLERSAALVVGALGVLKAGGAYVPLDPAYPTDRLAFMLHDAGVPVLLTQERLVAQLPTGPWEVVALDADAARIAGESADAPECGAKADTLAYVIYTSGSTGKPKGVEIEHGGLLNLVHWHQDAFAVTAADRATQLASPAFDAAVWELWPYLTAGATIVLPDEQTRIAPLALRDWLIAQEITVRYLLTGGDALRHYPSSALPFALINNYGPSESTVVATSGRIFPNALADSLPPLGWPIANTTIRLLDEDLQLVPDGEPGELCIGGDSLARGYLNRPDLTAERFIRDPFSPNPMARLYRTGDLARFLPDGQLQFLGRSDDQVKIRGYRIELNEIVATLNQCTGVQTSLVVAREDTPGNKRLVAYVVPVSDASLTTDALRDSLAATLPDYMVPVAFVRLEAFPLTTNGKVDRRALPAPDAANTAWDGDFVAPRTPTEEMIAALVAELVNVERVGVDENFFLLGGHSLLGTQLIARIRDEFGVDLPLRTIFEAPTIAELAAEVEARLLVELDGLSEAELAALLAE
jgi:acyl-CoA synthetase (AMP-forming)/AMP-acid ligase II/acyl carrier protein